jgi:hypothetical protein
MSASGIGSAVLQSPGCQADLYQRQAAASGPPAFATLPTGDLALIDSLSIIVPVYNAQSSLGGQMRELLELLPDLTSRFQVIVVDDGSTDHTLEVAHELARQYPQVMVVGTRVRQGHAAAADIGLRQATGDVVFIQETGRPVRSGDLLRLWHLRGEHNLQVAAGQPQPLDAGLIQRLTRWGMSLCDPPAESRPHGTLQMIRRSEVRKLHGPTSRPPAPASPAPASPAPRGPAPRGPAPSSPAPSSPAPRGPNRVRPASRHAAADRVPEPLAIPQASTAALPSLPPEDPHQLLDWSVKALYS